MTQLVKKAKDRVKFSLNTIYAVGNGALMRLMTTLMLVSMPVSSFAAINKGNVETGLKQVLAFVSWAFMWVGLCMLVSAIITFFSSIRNEDGEKTHKSISNAIVAIVIAANNPILNIILPKIDSTLTIPASPW